MAALNLNQHPGTRRQAPLTAADFTPTIPVGAPPPAEACTDIGCDADDDGGHWQPAAATPLWLVAALVVVAAAAIAWGPELVAWLLGQPPQP